MSIAYIKAMRSKDPKSQVGACIVNHANRIVGTGYNGMPDQSVKTPNTKTEGNINNSNNDTPEVWHQNVKRYYVCHAEQNAIQNSFGRSLENCRIYVTRTPCNECAKLIIQAGITQVICHSTKRFKSGYDKTVNAEKAALDMLKRANIKYRIFRPDVEKIVSSFRKAYDDNEKL